MYRSPVSDYRENGDLEVGVPTDLGIPQCLTLTSLCSTPPRMGLSSLPTSCDGIFLSFLSPFAILRLYLHPICDLYSLCFFPCRGYGFVKFTDELEQKRALTECQGAVGLGSKPVRLSVAIPKA